MYASLVAYLKLMPAQVKITLSADEKKQLEKNVRSKKTSVRLVERSRIILLAAEDIPNYKLKFRSSNCEKNIHNHVKIR